MPWAIGPPDGKYLVRAPDAEGDSAPTHVLVFATLGAVERKRLQRSSKDAPPEPEPTPVTTGRATVISVSEPFADRSAGERWLKQAGEQDLADDLVVLARALHSYRLVTADPYVQQIGRSQTLVARIGYGDGDQVADGRWTEARELRPPTGGFQRRSKVLEPQARLAAALAGRERSLVCEELALRAHLDLESGRDRESALQVLVALDAAITELATDPLAERLSNRIDELREMRPAVAAAAQAALARTLVDEQREVVKISLNRIEAALRARAVANA